MFSGRVLNKIRNQLTLIAPKSSFHKENGRKLLRSLHGCANIFPNLAKARCITLLGQAQGISTSDAKNKHDYDLQYEDILKVQKEVASVMIDVREQAEIDETMVLPGSIHIPMGNVSKYLTTMPEEEFKNTFHKNKPTMDTKIVVSCRSGKRSEMVQKELQKIGYNNVYNYTGGYLDWEAKSK